MWRGASLLDLRSIKPPVKTTGMTYPRLSLHKERPEAVPPYFASASQLAQATLSCSDNTREIVDYASDGLLEDLVTRGFGSTILTGEIIAAVAVAAIEKSRFETTKKPESKPTLTQNKNSQSSQSTQNKTAECKRVEALPVLRILSIGCGSGKIDIPFLDAIAKAHLRDGSLLQGRRFEYIGIDPSIRRLSKIASWVEREHPLWEKYLGGNPDYADSDSDTSAADDIEINQNEDNEEDGIKAQANLGETSKCLNLSVTSNGFNQKKTHSGGKMTVAQVLASIPRLRSCKDTSFYGLSRFPSLKQMNPSLNNPSLMITRSNLSPPVSMSAVSDTLLSTMSMKSGGLLSRTTMNMFDIKTQQRKASKAALLPLLQSDHLLETASEKVVEKTSCVSLISMSLEDLLESIDKTLTQTSSDAFREASDDVADSGASKADVFATPSHLCVAGSHFDLIFVEHALYGCRTTSEDINISKKMKKTPKKTTVKSAPLLYRALSSLRTLLRQRGRGIMIIIHRDPDSLNAIRCLAAPRIEESAVGAFGTPLYSLSLSQSNKYLSRNAALAASDGKLARSAHATAEESSSIRVETAVMLQHVHAGHVQDALEKLCGSEQVESRILSSHADTTRLCQALQISMDNVKMAIPVNQQQIDLEPKRVKMRRLTSFLSPASKNLPLFSPQSSPRTPRQKKVRLRKRDLRLLAYLTGVAVEEEIEELEAVDSDNEVDEDGDEALPMIGTNSIPMFQRQKPSMEVLMIQKLPPLELLLSVDMASVSFDKVLGRIGKVRTIAEMQEQAHSNKRKKNAVLLPDRLFIIRSSDIDN